MFYTKKELEFYEKPACSGNKKQKELLQSHGVTLNVHSILDTAWSKEELKGFFKELPNEKIVNAFAPAIKKGEINIKALTQDELIELMIENPILIKRPLMVVGNTKICGFDMKALSELLNINLNEENKLDTCTSAKSCNK